MEEELTTEHAIGLSLDNLLVFCALELALVLTTDAPGVFYKIQTTKYFKHLFSQIPFVDEYFEMVKNLAT